VQIADAAARSHVRVKLLLTEEHTRQVTAEVAEAIRYTAQALGTRPAPAGWVADRARRHAETRGWWPLDFWDDIDNDSDPEPVPDGVDEIAVMHALAGDMRLYWKRRSLGRPEVRLVDATGSMRILRALTLNGWDLKTQAALSGVDWNTLQRIRADGRGRVFPGHAAAISAMAKTLGYREGPSGRARRAAQARGWVSLLAWDEDTIDDPQACPNLGSKGREYRSFDHVCVDQALAGARSWDELTKQERQHVVRRLVEQRFWSDARIAEWLHTTDRTVLRTRKAAGIKAVPMSQLDAA
jgi:hypothetical protein